jgi:hypothetical protein
VSNARCKPYYCLVFSFFVKANTATATFDSSNSGAQGEQRQQKVTKQIRGLKESFYRAVRWIKNALNATIKN